MTFASLSVVEAESTIQLQVFLRITPSAIAVRVPQQSIVLVGKHEGNADLGVILEQVLVTTLHIQFFRLVLSQAVERLIVRTVEKHAPRQAITLRLRHLRHVDANLAVGNTEGFERLTLLCLAQQQLSVGIIEGHTARGFLDTGFHLGSFHTNDVTIGHRKQRLGLLRNDDQRRVLSGKLSLRRSLHSDDMVVHHLQTHYLGAIGLNMGYRYGYHLSLNGTIDSQQGDCPQRQHPCHHQSQIFHISFLFVFIQ